MPNEIRQNESRLNKLILEQSNILHKAKQLSDRASLGHYYDLTEQEQQLVEDYDCGHILAKAKQLSDRASLGHYYKLTEQEKKLVEEYDCGRL